MTGFQKWPKLPSELAMAQDLAQLFVADLGSSAVVRITGCANFASSVPFKKLVNGLIERGCAKFTLDLTDCKLMDSTFLGVLVGVTHKLGQAAKGVELFNPSEQVHAMFDNLGILELFEQANSLDQAEVSEAEISNAAKRELTENSLEAHRTLMDANPENEAKFKEVARFLEEDLKHQDEA
ncbi:MAG TPA: hypothetical protein DCP58_07655 [Verrucomicrobiales bacterium]|nr:hypothetical protein [Verrucomicrobiales bacterium]